MKSDLVGWTLAELSLAILFALFAAFAPSHQEAVELNRKLAEADQHAAQLISENTKLTQEQKEIQAEIENSHRVLRSAMTPSCWELDHKSDWLFTATINSEDSFEIDGANLTLAQIARQYSDQLDYAEKLKCRQRVHVEVGPAVTAREYDLGLRRLGQHFYVVSIGGD
jgi:hypothetical protein